MKVLIFGITLCSICCTCLTTNAQSIQKEGYIVLNNGDTLYGWINYYNWEKNPSSIGFSKDSAKRSIITYSKYDIAAVEVTGLDRYYKAIVTKDIRPINTTDQLWDEGVISMVTDTVLLRVLVKGSMLNLYELVDDKTHFFIQNQEGVITELFYKVASKNNSTINIQKIYINQLRSYLINLPASEEIMKKISNSGYTEKSLVPIVIEMNKISGTVKYVVAKGNKKTLFTPFAGAGGGYSDLRLSGTNSMLGNMRFSGAFVPFIAVGVEIASPRNLQAFALRLEASCSRIAYKGNGTQDIPVNDNEKYITGYAFTQVNISPTIALLYNFIRNESSRIYAGAGVACNIASYSGNSYKQTNAVYGNKEREHYLYFPKTWTSPFFILGARVNKKFSVEIDGHFISSITNYSFWSLTPTTVMGQVRYYF